MAAVDLPDVPALTSATATGWIGPDGTVGIFTRDETNAVVGHVIVEGVVSSPEQTYPQAPTQEGAETVGHRGSVPGGTVERHLHAAETYGDGFYIGGVRHKNARCRTCGDELEPRRTG